MYVNVKTYSQKFTDIDKKIKSMSEKIQKEIEELEELKKRNYWLGQIIHPLANDLGKSIGKPFVKVGNPTGINSHVWCEFHKTQKSFQKSLEKDEAKKGTYKSLVLFPGDLSKGQIYICNLKKKKDNYPEGYVNMSNYETVDTTGMKLQELIKYLF